MIARFLRDYSSFLQSLHKGNIGEKKMEGFLLFCFEKPNAFKGKIWYTVLEKMVREKRKLTKPQLLEAFSIMQEEFVPFQGQVTALGLSKVNPYQEF